MTLDSLPDLDTSGLCLVKTLPTALTCWPYRNTALRDGARTSTRTSSVAKGRTASIHCRPAPPRQTKALSSRTSRSRPLKVLERGYEGLIAKDQRSQYSGGPTTDWCKVKVRHEGRFLVGGIVDSEGDFGGILVGQRVGGELRYRGTVEWGFSGWTVTDLLVRSKLLLRATSPFADKSARHGVVWLRPRLAFEVSYAEVTPVPARAPVGAWP